MNKKSAFKRRLPVGAEIQSKGGTHFRVWAPKCEEVEVITSGATAGLASMTVQLEKEDPGYFSGFTEQVAAGDLYRFRLNGGSDLFPDPASRFQPEGPHGPSQVIDSRDFQWADADWAGVSLRGQVIYELHIGTFTTEGSWTSAARKLETLAELGITLVEVLPIAEFPGRFGWGYDGVNLFAPTRLYGSPDHFKGFVNRAHALGIGVILDVVYNHFGPDGNYLGNFSDSYFTDRYHTDWGSAINFDGDNSEPVREFFTANAGYWIDEFHLDGLRLDATQSIYDASEENILAVIGEKVRSTAQGRGTVLIAENEPQLTQLVRPLEEGGYGLDALWNDDFHHSARVALTGRNEAYYSDYCGTPQELLSAVKHGYLYQGQWSRWQNQRRGSPSRGVKLESFVFFTQNHDQVANSGNAKRVERLTSPGLNRAITALMLLGPGTPMLFQGQEFGASNPFFYFADHEGELAKQVFAGRIKFLRQFSSLELPGGVPDPAAVETFEVSKLDWSEREKRPEMLALHTDLLKLRHEDPVFQLQGSHGIEGAMLSDRGLLLRFYSPDGRDRLLIVNLGLTFFLSPAPEPLLAPCGQSDWEILWSSDELSYGGTGSLEPPGHANWQIPGQAAIVLRPGSIERNISIQEGFA